MSEQRRENNQTIELTIQSLRQWCLERMPILNSKILGKELDVSLLIHEFNPLYQRVETVLPGANQLDARKILTYFPF